MPGKKLLVADDSLTIQKVIRLALSNEGYEIQAVADGNDAVQQIALFRPDIILIDVSLPGISAFGVKREINQQKDLEEIQFVLMSSAFEKVDEEQFQEVKFHNRLTKPFDPAHLRKVLSDTLAQVAAKRMEKTSILTSPRAEQSSVAEVSPLSTQQPLSHSSIEFSVSEPEELPTNQSFDFPPLPSEPTFEPLSSSDNSDWKEGLDLEDFPPLPTPTPGNPSLASNPNWPNLSPPSEPEASESDIRVLTDSTMRMTGLDDFQWSVNELNSSLPTHPINLPLHPPQSSLKEATAPLIPPPIELESSPLSPTFPAASSPQKSTPAVEVEVSPISQEQIESLIREEVQKTLEKMASHLLPDLAEKLIKEEIHKLLTD